MEYRVKHQFADYGLKIGGELVAFVEVKRVALKLTESHLGQVLAYAVNHGLAWMLLTSGQVWQAYHRSDAAIGSPVAVDLFLTVDLLDSQTSLGDKVNKLFYLTKESFKRKVIDELWPQQAATSPTALASAILSEKVVKAVRLELHRRKAPKVEIGTLTDLIRETDLRTELTETDPASANVRDY